MQPKFGQVIRFHRKQSGLSQLELANLAGVGKTVVYDLEKGKESVQLNTLLKVLKALNIHFRLESPIMPLYDEGGNEKG
ncbi:MAG: type II toxin-antitoxin system Y4mF family antitoxin [Acidobacteriota bacterium]